MMIESTLGFHFNAASWRCYDVDTDGSAAATVFLEQLIRLDDAVCQMSVNLTKSTDTLSLHGDTLVWKPSVFVLLFTFLPEGERCRRAGGATGTDRGFWTRWGYSGQRGGTTCHLRQLALNPRTGLDFEVSSGITWFLSLTEAFISRCQQRSWPAGAAGFLFSMSHVI